LVQAGGQSYAWDANGNAAAAGSQVGADNQLSSDGTWTYGYDAQGNLVKKVGVSNGLTWTYAYDNANQLTSATLTGAGGAVLEQASYGYDALGRRVQTSVSVNGGAAVVSKMVYDGDTLYADLAAGGPVQTRYLAGQAADQWLASVDGSGNVAWLLTDRLGSVRDIVNSAGASLDHVVYDAFGNITSESNPGAGGRMRYAGYEWDGTTSLYHDAARYYDPATGRFITIDLAGLGPDSNLYRYVKNGPTDATDPSGHYLVSDSDSVGEVRQMLRDWGYNPFTKELPSGKFSVQLSQREKARWDKDKGDHWVETEPSLDGSDLQQIRDFSGQIAEWTNAPESPAEGRKTDLRIRQQTINDVSGDALLLLDDAGRRRDALIVDGQVKSRAALAEAADKQLGLLLERLQQVSRGKDLAGLDTLFPGRAGRRRAAAQMRLGLPCPVTMGLNG
jgi:RHS repeat-associated protein